MIFFVFALDNDINRSSVNSVFYGVLTLAHTIIKVLWIPVFIFIDHQVTISWHPPVVREIHVLGCCIILSIRLLSCWLGSVRILKILRVIPITAWCLYIGVIWHWSSLLGFCIFRINWWNWLRYVLWIPNIDTLVYAIIHILVRLLQTTAWVWGCWWFKLIRTRCFRKLDLFTFLGP